MLDEITKAIESLQNPMSRADIAQKNSEQEKLDAPLRTNAIQKLFAAEDTLAGDDSHLADLQRVKLAEAYDRLEPFSVACESVSQGHDLDKVLNVLNQMLEQISSFDMRL